MSELFSNVVSEIIKQFKDDTVCSCVGNFGVRGDSVLEQQFWHMLLKTKINWHGAAEQFQIGRHRVDSIIDCDGQAVVIELDGKKWHDVNADRVRDSEVIKSVDAIIRIPFAAMWYYRAGTFKILGDWFPRLAVSDDISVLTKSELQEEHAGVGDEESPYFMDQTEQDYLESIETVYDVIDVDEPYAWVGSPRQFLRTHPTHVITLQRGTAATGIIDRIYEKAECSHRLRWAA